MLVRTIVALREETGKTLSEITGETYTVGPCVGNGIVPSELDKDTHPCWVQYRAALDAISEASGADFSSLYDGTQYGHPFYIDENEGEDESEPCRRDVVADRGRDFLKTQGDEATMELPWFLKTC